MNCNNINELRKRNDAALKVFGNNINRLIVHDPGAWF